MLSLLLPGLDRTGRLFEDFVSRTPEGFETQIVSYPPNKRLGYHDCVNYVERQLPQRKSFIVLGESFSGPVSILLGSRSPAGLQGIVLCITFALRPAWKEFRFLPWGLAFYLPLPGYKIGLYLVDFNNQSRWVEPIRHAHRQVDPAVLAHRVREVLAVDVRSELSRLSNPVLALRGTEDKLVRKKSVDEILAVRPVVSVAHIRAPHLTLQIAPDESWSTIAAFSKGLSDPV